MVAVHIGPQSQPGGGLLGAAYRSSHGRAAILFVLLAGVGVSLLAGTHAPARRRHARLQLAWRAFVLLPAGVALQALPTNVAVILQYYAVYFVVAAAVLRWSDRSLLTGAALSATAGPVLLVWLHRTVPDWFLPGVPAWTDVGRIVRDVLLTGYYPVVVWSAPLMVGMVIGRRDLRDDATAATLLVAGAVAAATGFVLSDALVGLLGEATSDADWRRLAVTEPHSEMPLWLLTATGIATAALGSCLLLARRLPRGAWPLTALGQLALTVYVVHIVVLAVRPEWLVRATFGPAAVSLLRFTVVATLLAVAWRAVAPRGPLEAALRAPWGGRSWRSGAPADAAAMVRHDDDGDSTLPAGPAGGP
jgi:hypothetical protein